MKAIGVFFCWKIKDEGPIPRVRWIGRRTRKVSMQSRRPSPSLLAPKLKPAMWGSDSSGEVVGEGLPAASFPSSVCSLLSLPFWSRAQSVHCTGGEGA